MFTFINRADIRSCTSSVLTFPMMAVWRAVLPSLFLTLIISSMLKLFLHINCFISSICRSSLLKAGVWKPDTAIWRKVSPALFLDGINEGDALIKASTTANWPLQAAMCNAVLPRLSVELIILEDDIRSLTTSTCPLAAAACKIVEPCLSL
uniref:Uncharacterized protein MANES_15G156900 n=1 Tax=Rhizophora mucronata TaxID=61149 RepID=A0A2P2IZ55_RHIMU